MGVVDVGGFLFAESGTEILLGVALFGLGTEAVVLSGGSTVSTLFEARGLLGFRGRDVESGLSGRPFGFSLRDACFLSKTFAIRGGIRRYE